MPKAKPTPKPRAGPSPRIGSECGDCGKPLTKEECEYPWTSPHGEVVCQTCEYENYHFTCCVCGEYEETKYQHKVLAVFEAEEVFRHGTRRKAGLYRITELPYYADGMITMHVFEDCLKFVAPMPAGAECGYPAGHLCRDCITKHLGWKRTQNT